MRVWSFELPALQCIHLEAGRQLPFEQEPLPPSCTIWHPSLSSARASKAIMGLPAVALLCISSLAAPCWARGGTESYRSLLQAGAVMQEGVTSPERGVYNSSTPISIPMANTTFPATTRQGPASCHGALAS